MLIITDCMSGTDIDKLETVSKRSFLKQVGASATALSVVGASKVTAEEPSPEEFCITETVTSGENADCNCVKCWPKDVSGLTSVTVKLYMSNDPNGEDWGDFRIHNSNSGNGCTKNWDHTKDITHTYHSFQIENPDDKLNVQVNLPNYASEGTFDLELEKCQ